MPGGARGDAAGAERQGLGIEGPPPLAVCADNARRCDWDRIPRHDGVLARDSGRCTAAVRMEPFEASSRAGRASVVWLGASSSRPRSRPLSESLVGIGEAMAKAATRAALSHGFRQRMSDATCCGRVAQGIEAVHAPAAHRHHPTLRLIWPRAIPRPRFAVRRRAPLQPDRNKCDGRILPLGPARGRVHSRLSALTRDGGALT